LHISGRRGNDAAIPTVTPAPNPQRPAADLIREIALGQERLQGEIILDR
jgi:hypothetical protein